MPMGNHAVGTLTARRTAIGTLHLGVRAAFIKENQMLGRDVGDRFEVPALTPFTNVRSVSFLGDGRFFYG